MHLTHADAVALCSNKLVLWLLYTEAPEHVKNFTVVIVSKTLVQSFWCTDDQAKLYTVFWRRRLNNACIPVRTQLCQFLPFVCQNIV